MKTLALRAVLAAGCAALPLLIVSSKACAQTSAVLTGPPPTHFSTDERGVDLITGQLNLSTTDVVIGDPDQGGLAYVRTFVGEGWRDNMTGTLERVAAGTYALSFGGVSEIFSGTTSVNGSTLEPQSSGGFLYTRSDGLRATFSAPGDPLVPSSAPSNPAGGVAGRVQKATWPDGKEMEFGYDTFSFTSDPTIRYIRLGKVVSNSGYALYFTYANQFPTNQSQIPAWYRLTKVTGVNLGEVYCSPQFNVCNVGTYPWPSATYSGSVVTNQSGQSTTFTGSYVTGAGYQISGVRLPGSATDDITVARTSGKVSSYTRNGRTWNYAYSAAGSTQTTTVTDPGSHSWVATSNTAINRLTSWRDPLSNTTSYLYDPQGRLTRITLPEGNYSQYTYDGRANVTEVRHVAKPGSGLSDIATSASYPASCTNLLTCNRPITTTDERGGVTNYSYDSSTGLPTEVTSPAATTGAVRPQTRFTYQPSYAYIKTGTSTYGPVSTPVQRLTRVSMCATTASCVGTADEVVQTIDYGSNIGPNNRLPIAISRGAGNGSLTATTSLTYTPRGDIDYIDGPLAGSDDRVRVLTDAARRTVGVIGPDPDGTGSLKNRAQRFTYDAQDRVTTAEAGTTNGYTDSDFAAFASLQQEETDYEASGRPVAQRLKAGGTTYSLAQTGYDAEGRIACATVRMNPSVFASPPAPCVAGTAGQFGADRITTYTHDAADRLLSSTTASGQVEAITNSLTYSGNGVPTSFTDGEGHTTVLVTDGFDRASRLRYPNATGGGTSTTDYEEYGYDAASNLTSYRTRSAQIFSLSYDALNRNTLVDAPSGTQDVAAVYDLIGRQTQASIVGGQTNYLTWDVLSRLTSDAGALGTMVYQYDLAGRRTRMTWPDEVSVTYGWNVDGSPSAVRLNGAALLASFTYDNLGRRTNFTRGNGVQTVYSWDAASRLAYMTLSAPLSPSHQTWLYSWNPAAQIVQKTSYHSAYNYVPTASATSYTNNGLNQTTSVNGTGITWNANGDRTSDGPGSRSYNAADQMTAAGAMAMSYDALGRLASLAGGESVRFQYDGGQVSGVYPLSGSALTERWVPGFFPDEWLLMYEGSGTGSPVYPIQDERQSVVSLSNGNGTVTNFLLYDEYGQPAVSNTGRFQYTGQMVIAGSGLYHFKARQYDPATGKFLQPDRLGLAAGQNLYAYVAGDPVNLTDPTGLIPIRICHNTITEGTASEPGHAPDIIVTRSCYYTELGPSTEFLTDVSDTIGGFLLGLAGDNEDLPQCPTGPRVQLTAGYGATGFLGLVGGSVGGNVGVSIPASFLRNGSLRGIQFFGQVSATGLVGLGAYAGLGENFGYGISPGPLKTGVQPAVPVIQSGAGWGPGGELSLQAGTMQGGLGDASQGIQNSGGGGPRGAFGGYAAIGVQKGFMLASDQIGCE